MENWENHDLSKVNQLQRVYQRVYAEGQAESTSLHKAKPDLADQNLRV